MEEDSFPIRLLKSLGKQKLEKELKRLRMEEDIKILEELQKYCSLRSIDITESNSDKWAKFVVSIENLINRVKELEDCLNKRIASVEKCYQELIKPYKTEYGINVSLMTKKEKEEFINKRNCLLVQKHCYEEILQELLGEEVNGKM